MTDFNQIAAPASASGPDDERPVSISARLGRLQFHRSGKFRVLQLADIQDGPKVSKDTIRLIEASLDAARPDVVIFTGNQIILQSGRFVKQVNAPYRFTVFLKEIPSRNNRNVHQPKKIR